MQDPKINSHTRKPWYQRAKEMATQWRMVSSSSSKSSSEIAAAAASNSALLKSDHRVSKSARNGTSSSSSSSWKTTISSLRSTQEVPTTMNHHNNRGKLKKSSSLRVVTSSFTARVCLCAPISSYNEVFRADVPPRRSYSYPRSKPFSPTSPSSSSASIQERTLSARRISTDQGRRVVFRGKSLTDDVLMKRFVLEEEAMMQIRRRNEMEVIRRRRRSMMRRSKLGPSPLSRMVLADHQVEDDQES